MMREVLVLTALNAVSMKLSAVKTAGLMPLSINVRPAALKDLTKMAKAIITFKLMPESPDVDLEPIKVKALQIAKENGAVGEMQSKEDPIAFGLTAVLILAMYEVEGSDFDGIAAKMQRIEQVQSAEVARMDLALG